MKNALKTSLVGLTLVSSLAIVSPQAFADGGHTHQITGRSVAAGLLSFFIWPGIGQAVNEDKGDKVLTHALLGLTGIFRFWSGWDGLVDRKGGYWHGRI